MVKPWNILLYIFLGALGLWLCGTLLLPVGLPFFLGYLVAKLSRRFRPKNWHPTLGGIFSVSIIFLILCILLWLIIRTLFSEGEQLARRLPTIFKELSPVLDLLHTKLSSLAEKLPDGLSVAAFQWLDKVFAGSSLFFDSLSEWLLSGAARLLAQIPDLILFVMTTLLSAYFFAIDEQGPRKFLQKHIPKSWSDRGKALLRRLRSALGGYVKSQLYLSAVTLGICVIGLMALGYRKGFLIAIPIALIDALPVFGAGSVLIPWGIVSFLRGETGNGAGLILLYGLCSITRTVLEPRFLGKQMGLHPLLTLVSLYGGYRLFGIWGMILLPIGVILVKQFYDLSMEF